MSLIHAISRFTRITSAFLFSKFLWAVEFWGFKNRFNQILAKNWLFFLDICFFFNILWPSVETVSGFDQKHQVRSQSQFCSKLVFSFWAASHFQPVLSFWNGSLLPESGSIFIKSSMGGLRKEHIFCLLIKNDYLSWQLEFTDFPSDCEINVTISE